jgi:outer membrane protein assembly factor BamB
VRLAPIVLLLLFANPLVRALDWPHWRGPDRNGTSTETGWTDQWPDSGPPIAWKANVGLGFSSFVVSGGRACTVGHADGKDTVFCFDALTGKPVWTHSYPAELGDTFFEGGTTGTPTLDGDRLFWLSRWGNLFCLNAADGKVVWSRDLREDSGVRLPSWGLTGAPLVHRDLLVLNVGDAGLGIEKTTGKTVWKSANKEPGYSTPLPIHRDGQWLAVLASKQSYVAVNLVDGSEAWRIRWLTQYDVNAADPVIDGDRVFISTGYGKGAGLFQVTSGEAKSVWTSKVLRTQLNPAVLFEGHLYGADGDTSEKASLKCIEFATGAEKWVHRNFGSGGVIIVDGKLVAISGHGELMVAPASPMGFAPTARAQVLGGKCWTAPVLANGLIYCRNSQGAIAVVNVRQAAK